MLYINMNSAYELTGVSWKIDSEAELDQKMAVWSAYIVSGYFLSSPPKKKKRKMHEHYKAVTLETPNMPNTYNTFLCFLHLQNTVLNNRGPVWKAFSHPQRVNLRTSWRKRRKEKTHGVVGFFDFPTSEEKRSFITTWVGRSLSVFLRNTEHEIFRLKIFF